MLQQCWPALANGRASQDAQTTTMRMEKKNHPWKEMVGSCLLKSDSSGHTPVLHEAPSLWDEAESNMPRGLATCDVSSMVSREKQNASQRTKCVLEKNKTKQNKSPIFK